MPRDTVLMDARPDHHQSRPNRKLVGIAYKNTGAKKEMLTYNNMRTTVELHWPESGDVALVSTVYSIFGQDCCTCHGGTITCMLQFGPEPVQACWLHTEQSCPIPGNSFQQGGSGCTTKILCHTGMHQSIHGMRQSTITPDHANLICVAAKAPAA